MVIETFTGVEMYKIIKAKALDDRELNCRILTAKWMFIHNILGSTFPAKVRFIPVHITEEIDFDDEEYLTHQK
jgi:hypothetical protein